MTNRIMNKKTIVSTLRLRRIAIVVFALVAMAGQAKGKVTVWENPSTEYGTSYGEIIEGGLSATSTVMWWRSWNKSALEDATKHGNRVICTPNSEFYLDYEEDAKALGNIYRFNPTPATLNDQQQKLVLGVQGNLWTEWVPTRERMFYQAFPV